jgi:Cof subfamily protein (haloacid dehalogenase superfamily)
MYKLIAIDVDDTLLNDELEVTSGTKEALVQALEHGTVVTLATGRMFASAQKIARQLNLNVPIITYQGSLVKNLLDEQVLYERSVTESAVKYIINYVNQHHLHLQVYHNDILYVIEDNQKIRDYAAMSNIPYTIAESFAALSSLPLTKMIIIDDPARLDEIQIELEQALGKEAHITKSKPNFLEILHPEGTKGHAVAYLAAHYGCDLSEVIAIGDSWNDKEMLQVAGLGVAMDNAIDKLKEIADYVTLSNNEDGVKHVIDKFILQTNT